MAPPSESHRVLAAEHNTSQWPDMAVSKAVWAALLDS